MNRDDLREIKKRTAKELEYIEKQEALAEFKGDKLMMEYYKIRKERMIETVLLIKKVSEII
jgi:hypothetical protein